MLQRAVLVLLSVATIVACGDSGGTTSQTTTPTPAVPVTRVIGENSTTLPGQSFLVAGVTVGSSGDLGFNVNWAMADAELWTYIADGGCTVEEFAKNVCPADPACQCQFLATSAEAGVKPRRLTANNVGAGDYSLIVWNVGMVDTGTSWQVTLTTTTQIAGSDRSHSSVSEGTERPTKLPPSR